MTNYQTINYSVSQPALPSLENLRKIVGENYFSKGGDATNAVASNRDKKVDYLLHH